MFSPEIQGMLTLWLLSSWGASQLLRSLSNLPLFPEPLPHTSGHTGVGKGRVDLASPTFNQYTQQGCSFREGGRRELAFSEMGGWGFTRSHLLKSKKVIIIQSDLGRWNCPL